MRDFPLRLEANSMSRVLPLHMADWKSHTA